MDYLPGSLVFVAVLSALLLTRHANLTFIPAICGGAFIFFGKTRSWFRLAGVCSLIVPALLIYRVVCDFFGVKKGDEFKNHIGEHTFGTLLYLDDFFSSLGETLFPVGTDYLQPALAVAVVGGLPYLLFAGRFHKLRSEKVKIAGIVTIISVIQMTGFFGILHIREFTALPRNRIEERYLWHIALACMGFFAVVLTHLSQFSAYKRKRTGLAVVRFAPLLFALVCGLQAAATGVGGVSNAFAANMSPHIPFFYKKLDAAGSLFCHFVPKSHTIHRRFLFRPPAQLSDGRTVRPPRGPCVWHYRKGADGRTIPPPKNMWIMWDIMDGSSRRNALSSKPDKLIIEEPSWGARWYYPPPEQASGNPHTF